MTNVLQEAATADCPASEVGLYGLDKDETEAMVAAVSAYSDGYWAKVTITTDGLYFTGMENNTGLEFAMGRNGDTAAALTTATFGLYSIVVDWTVASSVCTGSGDVEGYFVGAAEVAASTDHDYSATGYVCIYYNSDATLVAKYDWAETGAFDTKVITDGYAFSGEWYMPKEPDTVPEDAEMADGVGDRWNKKETLWTSAGAGTPTVLCDESEKLKLGAATLVAGSVAFAAALSM